jgi:hypothetical protein
LERLLGVNLADDVTCQKIEDNQFFIQRSAQEPSFELLQGVDKLTVDGEDMAGLVRRIIDSEEVIDDNLMLVPLALDWESERSLRVFHAVLQSIEVIVLKLSKQTEWSVVLR